MLHDGFDPDLSFPNEKIKLGFFAHWPRSWGGEEYPPHAQVANPGNIIDSGTSPIDPHIVACLYSRNHSSGIVYFCQRGCHADLLRLYRFGRAIERTNHLTQGYCGP
jgi:hypothetical protein